MDLYEALYTTRAMRRVRPDPIPDNVVASMLDAAIRAPSGSNAQSWRWLTVTDRDTLAAMGRLYAAAWQTLLDTVYKGREVTDPQMVRVTRSSEWLAANFGTVPLVVLAYMRNDPSGASIYPAVWNLMLAARGHGVGTTLTTILGTFQGAAPRRAARSAHRPGLGQRRCRSLRLSDGAMGCGQPPTGTRGRPP